MVIAILRSYEILRLCKVLLYIAKVAAIFARLNSVKEPQREGLVQSKHLRAFWLDRSSLKTERAELLRRSDQKCRAFLSTAAT